MGIDSTIRALFCQRGRGGFAVADRGAADYREPVSPKEFDPMTRALFLPALLLWPLAAPAADVDPVKAAQAYRAGKEAVEPLSDTSVVCEAEEFRVTSPGWRARKWGENYYAATLANTFLSRKAFLGAPEQCERTTATITARVPKAGRYLALVRYEAVYRFETQFRLKVEQGGKTKLDRLYGAADPDRREAAGAGRPAQRRSRPAHQRS
jgi:hypothetical protein